ncbi:recombination protein RecR [Candidatus Gracilibacteria bacterium 28_42_T64]|nr:recombination protein RecR [Candidatus Gracilibacteria bacterium 28_42_T64]
MPEALKRLINSIGYLPGIGENRATKLAFFLLNANQNFIETLSENILNIKGKIDFCNSCNGLTDSGKEVCNICKSTSRNHTTIAVVEEYLDMLTVEQSGGYKGIYHVLGGAISPINGVFISDLSFEKLFERIKDSDEDIELILATNPNIEGEATTNYIKEEVEKRGYKYKTKITRLSRGLSSGYIEYADNITLMNALKERKEI